MPYPNEHACRLNPPDKYDKLRRENCAQKHDGKCIDVIYGVKDGKSEIQALRYPKASWTAAAARSHCSGRDGTFEAAGESRDTEPRHAKGFFKAEGGKFGIIASTPDVDRDNEIILPSAYKNLPQYLATNPVILFGHRYGEPPIAKATGGAISEEALRLDIEFAETPFAQEVRYLYEHGFMNAFSVGFIPKEWDVNSDGRRVYTAVELLEVSAVPVPANAAATMLREAKSKGVALPTFERVIAESTQESTPSPREPAETERKEAKTKRRRIFTARGSDMDRITLLKRLIAQTDDETERGELQTELEAAIAEKAKAEAKAEFEAAQKTAADKAQAEEMKAKAKASSMAAESRPVIRVLDQDRYKGFRLKGELDYAMQHVNPLVRQRMKERPEAALGVAKHFADLVDYSYKIGSNRRVEKAPMQEDTDSEGGYLTPIEQRNELLAYIRDSSKTLPRCRHLPMISDVMTVPAELTKVSVAFTAEETAATESDPTFAQVTLTAKRLDAYSVASNELLQDESIGLVGMLMSQFVEAIGQKIDSTVFKEGGTIVSGSGIFIKSGYSQVFGTGSSHFSAILEVDFRSLLSKIPEHYKAGGEWFIHRSPLYLYVYGLKDGDNRPLFLESYENGIMVPKIWGYPVVIAEEALSTSAASTAICAFGNLRGFLIGDRLTNISLFVNPYTKSTSYQTMFLLFTRWAFAQALTNYFGRIVTAA